MLEFIDVIHYELAEASGQWFNSWIIANVYRLIFQGAAYRINWIVCFLRTGVEKEMEKVFVRSDRRDFQSFTVFGRQMSMTAQTINTVLFPEGNDASESNLDLLTAKA